MSWEEERGGMDEGMVIKKQMRAEGEEDDGGAKERELKGNKRRGEEGRRGRMG